MNVPTHADVLRRRVTFTAQLKPDEKAEYVRHGDCISVKVMNLPRDFWYCPTVMRRFLIDPAEFDAEYQAGVTKAEKSITAAPESWKDNWIHKNISRCCIRSDNDLLKVQKCNNPH